MGGLGADLGALCCSSSGFYGMQRKLFITRSCWDRGTVASWESRGLSTSQSTPMVPIATPWSTSPRTDTDEAKPPPAFSSAGGKHSGGVPHHSWPSGTGAAFGTGKPSTPRPRVSSALQGPRGAVDVGHPGDLRSKSGSRRRPSPGSPAPLPVGWDRGNGRAEAGSRSRAGDASPQVWDSPTRTARGHVKKHPSPAELSASMSGVRLRPAAIPDPPGHPSLQVTTRRALRPSGASPRGEDRFHLRRGS